MTTTLATLDFAKMMIKNHNQVCKWFILFYLKINPFAIAYEYLSHRFHEHILDFQVLHSRVI